MPKDFIDPHRVHPAENGPDSAEPAHDELEALRCEATLRTLAEVIGEGCRGALTVFDAVHRFTASLLRRGRRQGPRARP